MQQRLIPVKAFPPGRILQKEIEARNWTEANLVAIDKDLPEIISAIVQDKRQITLEIAEKLAEAFGTSVQSWINLENNYRLYLARKALDSIKNLSEI
ncbi:transcriptional regulator [Desmonostoc muscorum CCALA 125]|uniref:Transcriptional regulator n=1 Tax=Desmonostoc muscorum LEGE 12446 TaxID=1828758 RepID=A0A8J7AA71_DESMC|nr:transcriptional regulator [Desmonostoc muscorum]MBX9256485.1 transcriptional regulator [Desmonostoc muscorum CCALA 125]MCF2151056.1 transcriptional regulator [Desmonostoc muscorum LEGE 12446]